MAAERSWERWTPHVTVERCIYEEEFLQNFVFLVRLFTRSLMMRLEPLQICPKTLAVTDLVLHESWVNSELPELSWQS